MTKVLAIIELDTDHAGDDSELNLLTASFIDLLDDIMTGQDDRDREDLPIYLCDEITNFSGARVLSTRVLNSATESALNHLYPRYIVDVETDRAISPHLESGSIDLTMTRPHAAVMSRFPGIELQRIEPTGPAPTGEEALLLMGISPSNLSGVNADARLVDKINDHGIDAFVKNRERRLTSYKPIGSPLVPLMGLSAERPAGEEGLPGPVGCCGGEGPSGGAGPVGSAAENSVRDGAYIRHLNGDITLLDTNRSLEIRADRGQRPIDVAVEHVLEITSPLGDRYTIPLDHVPDPLKEDTDMLKKLRDFFTDPFKRNSRISGRHQGGTVTGRFTHTPTPAQTADDLTAAVLMHAILTNEVDDPASRITHDDITKADEQAKKVVGMAEAEFTPIRTTEAYHESVLRDLDPAPVETSRPVADEDRSAAAAIESRPVETSSYRDDTPSSSWADSSGSSSSDSYSSSSSSDSYSSSSVD